MTSDVMEGIVMEWMMLLYLWLYSLMLLLMMLHSCFDVSTCCATWKGRAKQVQLLCGINRNMSKSKGWTLQSSLLMLWMEKTLVNNQTTIDDNWKTY